MVTCTRIYLRAQPWHCVSELDYTELQIQLKVMLLCMWSKRHTPLHIHALHWQLKEIFSNILYFCIFCVQCCIWLGFLFVFNNTIMMCSRFLCEPISHFQCLSVFLWLMYLLVLVNSLQSIWVMKGLHLKYLQNKSFHLSL